MSRQISLLITGLTMEYSKVLTPAMDTAAFGAALNKSLDTLLSIPNLYSQRFDLDPSAPSDAPSSTESLMKVIRQGPPRGGHWDAHLIGAGVKKIPSLRELFEDTVNVTVEASGGKTKLLFSETGADHWRVVRRGLKELELRENAPMA